MAELATDYGNGLNGLRSGANLDGQVIALMGTTGGVYAWVS